MTGRGEVQQSNWKNRAPYLLHTHTSKHTRFTLIAVHDVVEWVRVNMPQLIRIKRKFYGKENPEELKYK